MGRRRTSPFSRKPSFVGEVAVAGQPGRRSASIGWVAGAKDWQPALEVNTYIVCGRRSPMFDLLPLSQAQAIRFA